MLFIANHSRLNLTRPMLRKTLFGSGGSKHTADRTAQTFRTQQSSRPNGRNCSALKPLANDSDRVRFTIIRDDHPLIGPSPLGPVLAVGGTLGKEPGSSTCSRSKVDESFQLPWGKTGTVVNRCSKAVVTLATPSNLRWEVELRAYDDGVAFRYRLPKQEGLQEFELRDEVTQFDAVGEPRALFNTLDGFTTSHESLYEHKPLSAIPVKKLLDMPLLLVWPNGQAAAITEARVRHFAGMYLERPSDDNTALRCRLSPLPSQKGCVCRGQDAP